MNHAVTRWSDADFIVKEKIGKGHFGNIYRAINTRKEFDQECETNQRSSNQLNKPSTIALKCFSKRAILTNYREGGRTLQLLKREINIHSQ